MIVGLTGGIGSGKSTVAKMFSDLNIPVYIADDEAKQLMNNTAAIRNAIIQIFGKASYEKNVLNRKYLAAKVFQDKALLNKLNAIVHPAVKKHFQTWYSAHSNAPYVIKEAAVLFENNGYKECDYVITVVAPEEIRIQRVMERDRTSREAVLARIQNQWSDADKLALTDFSIENIDLATTMKTVHQIHEKLLKKK